MVVVAVVVVAVVEAEVAVVEAEVEMEEVCCDSLFCGVLLRS